jgi:hypothetical protein
MSDGEKYVAGAGTHSWSHIIIRSFARTVDSAVGCPPPDPFEFSASPLPHQRLAGETQLPRRR